MTVLVTGGAGYIGSHTVVALCAAGHQPIIADNLSNASAKVIKRLETITGATIPFYKINVCDEWALEEVFAEHPEIEAVIHFAGYKAVGESVEKPLMYYQNNLDSMLTVLKVMQKNEVENLVFSSSATVYGEPAEIPLKETTPCTPPGSPYGQTKSMIEQILRDMYHANPGMNIALLRYFNPIGAHESGLIGEDPNGIPNNLLPYIAKTAVGVFDKVRVYGDDYPTKDGTGVRDYIHVMDLADGHVKALDKLAQNSGLVVYNLGTGNGYSVLEVVKAFEKACGKELPYEVQARRAGDFPEYYADATLAKEELGWEAKYSLDDMCASSWNWQKNNPNGYEGD